MSPYRPHRGIEFPSRSAYENLRQTSHYNPPKWIEAQDIARQQLQQLVDRRVNEQQVHSFLEEHPYLLPGLDFYRHGPAEGIIATKFSLGNDFVADFAFVSSDSQHDCITCIEIESPKKKLFRKDGAFNRDYFDARQQVVDWLQWANNHVRSALDCWGYFFRGVSLRRVSVRFQGILVFGRRADINTPKKQQRWSAEADSLNGAVHTMTYDRIISGYGYGNLQNGNLLVCNYRDRQFQVKHICD